VSVPPVTVFVPLYNNARYVGAAIESVLKQSHQDFELLVIDDGSEDGGRARVEAIRDSRVRLVVSAQNRGLPTTRNLALDLASGRYLANLDSDDVMHPQRLARQLAFLEANPHYVAVGSWCGFIDAEGRRLVRVKRHVQDAADIHAEMLFHCPLSNRSAMARTEVLRRFGYRHEFVVRQDADLFCRLAREHPLANLPEVLVWGRRHAGQITGHTATLRRPLQMKIADMMLRDLGINASGEELEQHFHVGRAWPEFQYDKTFLRWTAGWLDRIASANAETRRHPPGTLERALGAAWARTCWQARKRFGPAILAMVGSSRWSLAACRAADCAARRFATGMDWSGSHGVRSIVMAKR